MSYKNYELSKEIEKMPYEAVLMGVMRSASEPLLSALINQHPTIWDELKERYNSPGGKLKGE